MTKQAGLDQIVAVDRQLKRQPFCFHCCYLRPQGYVTKFSIQKMRRMFT